MRVEELERLRPAGPRAAAPGQVVHLDRELLQVVDAAVDLADQGHKRRGDQVVQDPDRGRIRKL